MVKNKAKTPLRKAVDWLRYTGKINKDEDLVEILKVKKNTISTYLNGKPGKRFLDNFEHHFNIKVARFEDSSKISSKELLDQEFKEPLEAYNNLRKVVSELVDLVKQDKALINLLTVEIMEVKAALKISTTSLEQKFATDAQIALDQVEREE